MYSRNNITCHISLSRQDTVQKSFLPSDTGQDIPRTGRWWKGVWGRKIRTQTPVLGLLSWQEYQPWWHMLLSPKLSRTRQALSVWESHNDTLARVFSPNLSSFTWFSHDKVSRTFIISVHTQIHQLSSLQHLIQCWNQVWLQQMQKVGLLLYEVLCTPQAQEK